jgi:hypothetical protein
MQKHFGQVNDWGRTDNLDQSKFQIVVLGAGRFDPPSVDGPKESGRDEDRITDVIPACHGIGRPTRLEARRVPLAVKGESIFIGVNKGRVGSQCECLSSFEQSVRAKAPSRREWKNDLTGRSREGFIEIFGTCAD